MKLNAEDALDLRLRCLELALGEVQGRSAGWPNIVNAAAAYEAFVLNGAPVGNLAQAGTMITGETARTGGLDRHWPNRFPDDIRAPGKPARQKAPAKPKRAKR